MTTAHDLHLEYFQYWPIKVSFCTCSFVVMYDRTPRTILWSQTCLNTLTDMIITRTTFVAQFTSGLFPHLGKTPGHHIWHLHQVFICHWLSVDQFLWVQAQPSMSDYAFFSKDPSQWGKPSSCSGGIMIFVQYWNISCCCHNSVRTLLSHQCKGLGWSGEVQKWCCFSPSPNWRVHSRR